MSNIDKLLHELDKSLWNGNINFKNCPQGYYKEYEYYYCENMLYLVRHKKSKAMLFISAFNPKEAIEIMSKRLILID